MSHRIKVDDALSLVDQLTILWKQSSKDKEFRRAVVANLYNRKKTQTEIARLLGVSIDRVHRDITSLYRTSFSSVCNPAGSQDYLSPQRRGLSANKRNTRAREKRAYHCDNCPSTFNGSGCWKIARKHAKERQHYITKAGKLVYGPERGILTVA